MNEEVKVARLQPGLPVSDVLGEKIGTVAHVYQQAPADQPTTAETVTATPSLADKVVEVKTGVLGLGKHYYIPAPVIETVTDDQIVLSRPRDEIESAGWTNRPTNLKQVT
jgi:hypothetical protein